MHLVQVERIDHCPACGSHNSDFWCIAKDRLYNSTPQDFEYRSCNDCKTIYQSLRPLESEIGKCYTPSYGPHAATHQTTNLLHVPRKINNLSRVLASKISGASDFNFWMNSVDRKLAGAGNILDFGCGSGKYLDKARKLGCTTVGIDFSPTALAEARRRGHEALEASDATWSQLQGRRFRFVRLNHVIEHLYHPKETLRKIFDVMESGATIHISTPNPLGPSATQYRAAWWGLECPRHIALIPPDQTIKILKEIGFSSIEVAQEPAIKDAARSWAYTKVDQGKLQKINVEQLADDGPLNLFFSIKHLVSSRNKVAADRYHLTAVK